MKINNNPHVTFIRLNSYIINDVIREFASPRIKKEQLATNIGKKIWCDIKKISAHDHTIILTIQSFSDFDTELIINLKRMQAFLTGYNVSVLVLGDIPKKHYLLFDNVLNITHKIKCPYPIFHYPLEKNLKEFGDSENSTSVLPIPTLTAEPVTYDENGYIFNGKNPLYSCHESIPYEASPRSIVFALKCQKLPTRDKPMFFFSYGERKHDCAFGLFWGIPQIKGKDGDSNNNNKNTLRFFLYAAIEAEARTSDYCDIDLERSLNLNKWYVISIVYTQQNILNIYLDNELIKSVNIILKTRQTNHINIGGFLIHNVNGSPSYKDIPYSMCGRIREFQFFDKALNRDQITFIEKQVRMNVEA